MYPRIVVIQQMTAVIEGGNEMFIRECRKNTGNNVTEPEFHVKRGLAKRQDSGSPAMCRRQQSLRPLPNKHGFGLNEVIGIAAGVIIAVLVVVPGLRIFATEMLDNLQDWWTTMSGILFTST